MKIIIQKNEKRLLLILGLLAYLLVIYKVVWLTFIPEIREKNQRIDQLQQYKQKLDNEISQTNVKKLMLISKNTEIDRFGAYVDKEANVTDCIEYIEKTARIINEDVRGINITAPILKETKESRFYELKMDFVVKLSMSSVKDLLNYIENSSKIINVVRFSLVKATETTSSAKEDKLYEVFLTLKMYALEKEAADKLYELGRHRMYRFEDDDVPTTVELASLLNSSSESGNNSSGTIKSDYSIQLNSFLSAGDNFVFIGNDPAKEKLSIKTNQYLKMELSLTEDIYTVILNEANGKTHEFTGRTLNKDQNMRIQLNLSQIQENKDMGIQLKIKNSSQHKLNIVLSDPSGRVNIVDREQKEISSVSENEKVTIQ